MYGTFFKFYLYFYEFNELISNPLTTNLLFMKFHVSHGGIASKSRGAYTVCAEISNVSMTVNCEIVYVFTRVCISKQVE